MDSDYIVFVDESGDHSLTSIDASYPIFALSFCIMRKDVYANELTPKVRELKFATFGHDMAILHEHDIRKKTGAFAKLSKDARENFMDALGAIIRIVPFHLLAVVIDKRKLTAKYVRPEHPYHLAMKFGLERLHGFLKNQGQGGALTYLVCEARGKREDISLELQFRRICDYANFRGHKMPFDIVVADKRTNSEGLQIADLMARPIGLSVLRPDQPNRAMGTLEPKWLRGPQGRIEGYGLKVFP